MSGVILLILRFLFVIALYVFLGWSLLILWRDLRQQREILASQKTPTIGLKNEDENVTEAVRFKGIEVTIGRDPACEYRLLSEKVSANHARLSFHHNQWWIEDLHSTNGTHLNNDPVTAPTVVTNGDQVRCGDIRMTIILEG